MSNHVTITGRLGADPELRFTASGAAVCGLRVVDQERRKNDQTGQWEDAGEPLWMSASIWSGKAEAVANTARKGDLVTVVGRLVARSWDDKETGQKRTVTEVKATEVAIVPKVERSQQPAQSGGWGGGQAQADPWGQQPTAQPQQQTGGAGNAYDEPPF